MNILRWVLLFNNNLFLLVNILEYIVRGWELIKLPLEYSSVQMTLEYNLNYESQ